MAMIGLIEIFVVLLFACFVVAIGIAAQVALLGGALHVLFGFDILRALLFAVIIIPTDPIGVLAALQETDAEEHIEMIAKGESLFDDAIAVVMYVALLSVLAGHGAGGSVLGGIAHLLTQEVLLSITAGIAAGAAAFMLLRFARDPELQVLITLLAAYGGFLAAHYLAASGILLVVALGVTLGSFHRIVPTKAVIGEVHGTFWRVFTFLLTSILYLLIGVLIQRTHGLADYLRFLSLSTAIFLIMNVVRWGLLFLLLKLAGFLQKKNYSLRTVAFLAIGSLKGPISVAMLIALPLTLGGVFVQKACVIGYTIVLFSIVGQGVALRLVGARLLKRA